ncbi:DUF6712 family protein [Sphingobacterium multivorum]|uniref:DUF6712 family protein n=1 Tax=Sphingobacterium multivorum TaxID=28454 RepID=UPI0031BB816F
MLISTTEELKELTGSWYASNEFDPIMQDIEDETDDLALIVGDDIIDKAREIQDKTDPSENEQKLLKLVKRPIAIMAVLRFYQSNLVSHDQSTRKIKIDKENESVPWEWMLDKDDEAHLNKAQRAIDRLISFLDKSDFTEWKESDAKKEAKSLFVNSTKVFGEYYPIDNSARFYYMAIPLLREVQTLHLKEVLGSDYKILLDAFQENEVLSEYEATLLDYARRAQALATVALAVRRLNAKVLPEGIVKSLKSSSQTVNASRAAITKEIDYFSKRMEADAFTSIDKIKRYRFRNSPEYLNYQMLPNHDPKDKFLST